MAINIPNAAKFMPRLAVSGEPNDLIPKINKKAERI
jgi:hypothetical protein